jgi:hypothetical protein
VLGVPVQLTDDQFQSLLARLSTKDLSGPSTQEPLISQPIDPDDSPSESSNHGSYRDRQPRPHRRHQRSRSRLHSVKRSPKHNDPGQLDDGTSPTYNAWCILLEGKLDANADWWPTQRSRIDYVFSQTTGKAQEHLEPRMIRTSPNRWKSVEEILDHLDIVFRDYFQKEKAADQYVRLIQQPSEDFNDFHSEFA